MQHVQHTFSALLNQLLNGATCEDKFSACASNDKAEATPQDETASSNTGPFFFLAKFLLFYVLGSGPPEQDWHFQESMEGKMDDQ